MNSVSTALPVRTGPNAENHTGPARATAKPAKAESEAGATVRSLTAPQLMGVGEALVVVPVGTEHALSRSTDAASARIPGITIPIFQSSLSGTAREGVPVSVEF